MFTVGLFLGSEDKIVDVLWDGPAFKAGLAPGMKLISVDGKLYNAKVLRDEIVHAQQSKKPVQVNVQHDGSVELHTIDYSGGLRYPHVVRVQGRTDYLSEILASKPATKE
jgi:predicted metalloprotease with PDZ domain